MKIELKCACGASAIFETNDNEGCRPTIQVMREKFMATEADKWSEQHKNHAAMFGKNNTKEKA